MSADRIAEYRFADVSARRAPRLVGMLAPMVNPLDDTRIDRLRHQGIDIRPIGLSQAGRPLYGCSIGAANLPLISVVAGAHPDEPAGPLAALALLQHWHQNGLAKRVRLAVVPQLDVDGTVAQTAWLTPWSGHVDLLRYAEHALRRPLGEDREFGWPGAPWGGQVLPECAAASAFLDQQGPAIGHLSLHGMGIAAGAWYLLDDTALRHAGLWRDLRRIATERHLPLHDSPRHGDKGFRRVGRGFCTTPSGIQMRRWALTTGRPAEAAAVAYGSMDAARARARAAARPAPLCAVSEFPLALAPTADGAGPGSWRQHLAAAVLADKPQAAIQNLLQDTGLRPVPLLDQVTGMVAMVHAVARAALRAHEA